MFLIFYHTCDTLNVAAISGTAFHTILLFFLLFYWPDHNLRGNSINIDYYIKHQGNTEMSFFKVPLTFQMTSLNKYLSRGLILLRDLSKLSCMNIISNTYQKRTGSLISLNNNFLCCCGLYSLIIECHPHLIHKAT